MAITQVMPVPVMLDTREPLLIDKKSSPNLSCVRSTQGALLTSSGTTLYTTAPTANIRNLSYMYLDDGSNPYIEGLLILTATGAYFKPEAAALVDLGETYSWTPVRQRLPRYAVVNTRGLGAWTAWNQLTAERIRVRIFGAILDIIEIVPDYAATFMTAFNDRLLIARTNEAGIPHLARLRWCVNGNYLDWTGIGSGFIDVTSYYPGRIITGIMELGEKRYLSFFREIVEVIPTGNPSPAFTLETRILGTGMALGQTWAATEYFGFFLGIDNVVYRWDGANLQSVSVPIAAKLAAHTTPTDLTSRSSQAVINVRDHEYWLLPDHGNLVFIYDYREERWFTDTYPVAQLALGAAFRNATVHDSTVFLGDTTQQVQLLNPKVFTYNGTPLQSFVETPDYTAQEIRSGQLMPTLSYRNTALAFRFRWTGDNPVEVGYSIDKGLTWTTQMVTVNADGEGVAWFVRDFNRIRFRLRVTTALRFELTDMLSYDWQRSGAQL